jgi:hypothetical protein
MTDASSIYHKARAEVASMLRLQDLDNLTGEDAIRLDVGTSLRVLMDNQSGRLLRGESLDARELLAASEALSRILPPLREPPSAPRVDPRQIMFETYMGMRKRGAAFGQGYDGLKLTVERLQAELASKDAEIAALKAGAPASGEPMLASPLPNNVVALPNATAGKQNAPAGPAASAAPTSPPAKPFVNGLSDIPQSVRDTRPPNEAWRNFVRIDWQG